MKLIPPWAWLVLAMIGLAGMQSYRLNSAQAELANEKLAHSQYREAVADRDRAASVKSLIKTRRRIEAQEEIDRDAENKTADYQDSLARADDKFERLQQRFDAVSARSRACGNTITEQLGKAAEDAARVQSDMFGRIGAAAKLYAGVADERGIAGSACEASYQSLKDGAEP